MAGSEQTRTWIDVARAWQHDEAFRDAYTRMLADQPHDAFAWETVPSTAAASQRAFQDIVVPSPALARVSADPGPFHSHFASAVDGVCTFRNLGGDALLVAPAPLPGVAHEHYAHLAAFVRQAPRQQIHALWREVGRAVRAQWQLSDDPLWVSTAGLGVYWLHVRLDRRPKYYRHGPFRRM